MCHLQCSDERYLSIHSRVYTGDSNKGSQLLFTQVVGVRMAPYISSPGAADDSSLHVLPPIELVSGHAPKSMHTSPLEMEWKGLYMLVHTLVSIMCAQVLSYLGLLSSKRFQCMSRVGRLQLVLDNVKVSGVALLPLSIAVAACS